MEPIFICGQHRSGTTLLSGLLDGHSRILSLPGETHFFTHRRDRERIADPQQRLLWLQGRGYDHERKQKLPFGTPIDPERNWEVHAYWQRMRDRAADPEAVARPIREALCSQGHAEAFRVMTDLYRQLFWEGAAPPLYVVEKSPGNEFHLPYLAQEFPRARFVQMVRDPFDAIASRVRNTPRGARARLLVAHGLEWLRSFSLGHRFQRRHPDRHRFVRYETLATEPRPVLTALAAFLGIPFEAALLTPTQMSGRDGWQANTDRVADDAPVAIHGHLARSRAMAVLSDEEGLLLGWLLGPFLAATGITAHARFFAGRPPAGMLTARLHIKGLVKGRLTRIPAMRAALRRSPARYCQ